MHWFRRRHWFHLQGNFGGLRYEGRFGVFELAGIDERRTQLMLAALTPDRGRTFALQVWESEGGALRGRARSSGAQSGSALNAAPRHDAEAPHVTRENAQRSKDARRGADRRVFRRLE